MSRPEITYPCTWSYKIIASELAAVVGWVGESLRAGEYELTESNRSSSGRYVSIELSIRVENQAVRDEIFRSLQGLDGVKVVL